MTTETVPTTASAPRKPGDQPWLAQVHRTAEVRVPCPVCFGKLSVTLILGNGERLDTPCGYCLAGREKPSGYETEWRPAMEVSRVVIDKVEIEETRDGQRRRYLVGGNGAWRIVEASDLFASEEEATVRAVARLGEMSNEAAPVKFRNEQSYSWNAGYHMREAKRAKASGEYHERMAVLCKARARITPANTIDGESK